MTSRERLFSVLKGEVPDRVPISTYELVGYNTKAWENNEPSYSRLMDKIRSDADCIAMCQPDYPANMHHHFLSVFDPDDFETEIWAEGSRQIVRTTLHTPAGDFTTVDARDKGVKTTWHIKRMLETPEDIERFLAVSYTPPELDFSDLERIRSEVGERGVIMPSIPDPLCVGAELFEMSTFTIVAFTEQDLFKTLLETLFPRVMNLLGQMLRAGAGDLYRIVGPEYASEPYLPPELFSEFVVPFDKAIAEAVREAGAFSRLHCHGNVRNNVPSIKEIAPDAVDPLEPPPDGDISIAEFKKLAPEIAVFGNIELKILEHGSEHDVEQSVRSAMEEGKPGGRFCLMPTAAPINVPLAPKTERNYFRYLDTALRLAPYS